MRQLSLPFYFPGRRFDDFWVHERNKELVFHLTRLLAAPKFCSVYFWGKAGSGKTHLLEALCRHVDEQGLRAAYVDLKVVPELCAGMFEGLEYLDCVCLDNLHWINDESYYEIQVSIFRLYNEMRALGKPLAVSSECPLHGLEHMIPDLRSRLGWELVYQLYSFDQLDQRAFLQWFAIRKGMVLTEAGVNYILSHANRESQALILLLQKLEAISLREQRKLTIPFIRRVMAMSLEEAAIDDLL